MTDIVSKPKWIAPDERHLRLPLDLYMCEHITYSHPSRHVSAHTQTRTQTYTQTQQFGVIKITNARFESLTIKICKDIIVDTIYVLCSTYFSSIYDPTDMDSPLYIEQLSGPLCNTQLNRNSFFSASFPLGL